MKNFRFKRCIAFVLGFSLCAGVLSGCGSAATSGGGYTEDGVLELEFFNKDGEEDLWDNPVAQKLTEKTGIRLKVDYPVAADDMKVALMIAEQNFPDMIYAKGDVASLVEAGALLDLTDLIEELSSYPMGATPFKDAGNAQIQWAVLKENDYQVPRTLDDLCLSLPHLRKRRDGPHGQRLYHGKPGSGDGRI